ncbi:uncharacterized protein BDZ99DRAFT_518738 [Mytilinidion resinicola]|uniref:Uncharacterized protein n=1 Tax=Mytilinidion resinicola TaxID=574789 RepID=A0A6A6YRB4_9PEZI|nr:uncharacterized protein BDZ99DRAFT_518738 [Mytilinidion resinicola]KAF2811466.1 hypothetical protein BDZ99DRAFT_518738 [Mytilinidion resinicola]
MSKIFRERALPDLGDVGSWEAMGVQAADVADKVELWPVLDRVPSSFQGLCWRDGGNGGGVRGTRFNAARVWKDGPGAGRDALPNSTGTAVDGEQEAQEAASDTREMRGAARDTASRQVQAETWRLSGFIMGGALLYTLEQPWELLLPSPFRASSLQPVPPPGWAPSRCPLARQRCCIIGILEFDGLAALDATDSCVPVGRSPPETATRHRK